MLLNQQHVVVLEAANFNLFINKPGLHHFTPRNKMPHMSKFPPRNFSPKLAHSPFASRPKPPQANTCTFSNQSTNTPCQICGKKNHQTFDCYHRMDYSYQGRHPPTQLATMVAHTNTAFEDQGGGDDPLKVTTKTTC